MPYSRFGTCLAHTDPALITPLAAEASLWGLGPEYVERTSKYHTIIGAPFNALKYGPLPLSKNLTVFVPRPDLSPATSRFHGPSGVGTKFAARGTFCKTKLPGTKAGPRSCTALAHAGSASWVDSPAVRR